MAETTLAFLMTDVVGSSALAEGELAEYLRRLAAHDRLARETLTSGGGTIVKSRGEGDSVFATFPTVDAAAGAARAFAEAVEDEGLRLRCAIHIGPVTRFAEDGQEDFRGDTVNRCARLRSLAEPGEVLLTRGAVEMLTAHEVEPHGTHAVRGLARPIEAHRLVGTGTGEARPPLRGNLPTATGALIGRVRLTEAVLAAWGAGRPCALIGPEGIGKTRVAVEAARAFGSAESAWMVSLAGVGPDGYEGVIRDTLGLEDAAPSARSNSTLPAAIDLVRPGAIIILDDPSDATTAAELGALVARNSSARVVLTTTEEPSAAGALRGWTAVRVDPLEPSDEGIALLREAASQMGIDPRDSAEDLEALCAELGGSPLAIELAASRLRFHSAQRLGVRLAQSVAGTGPEAGILRMVAETYERLNPTERRLLRLLAIFPAGFSADHAECFGQHGAEAFERLVAKSAAMPEMRCDSPRFRLPHPLQRLALREISEEERADATGVFVSWATCESAAGLEEGAPWRRIEDERENLEAGFESALATNRVSDAAQILKGLRKIYLFRARAGAGRHRYESLLANRGALERESLADATNALGIFAWMSGDYEAAREACGAAVELYEQLGKHERARAISVNRAIIEMDSGALETAEALAREFAAGGGPVEAMHLADILWRQGKFEEAEEVAAPLERDSLASGDVDTVEALRVNRASALLSWGRVKEGEREFLRVRADGSPLNGIYALLLAARIAAIRGAWRLALRCLSARSRAMIENGHRDAPVERKYVAEIQATAPISEFEEFARDSTPDAVEYGAAVAELLSRTREVVREFPESGTSGLSSSMRG